MTTFALAVRAIWPYNRPALRFRRKQMPVVFAGSAHYPRCSVRLRIVCSSNKAHTIPNDGCERHARRRTMSAPLSVLQKTWRMNPRQKKMSGRAYASSHFSIGLKRRCNPKPALSKHKETNSCVS